VRIALAAPAADALAPRFEAALARAGHELQRWTPARGDLHPQHWQKSWHPATTRALRKLLREERIEVLHVLGWRGLSRDLVHGAARERVPAVLSLQDASASCLLGTRILPQGGACEAAAGPNPCLRCAASVEPRTPWVPPDAQFLAQYTHQQDLERELRLARALLVHDAAAREHARRFVQQPVLELELAGLAESELAARLTEIYARALAAGAPDPGAPENPYALLLGEAAAREWDAAALRASG
jgi:hypothetical protein